MNKLKHLTLLLLVCLSSMTITGQNNLKLKESVQVAMKKATKFMVEKVSYKGGYVWYYSPDLSRSWGEMEAYPTMIWTQPPGTPSMGNLFLDAYHATGDEYYYQAAEEVANALIFGQLECGGWNYIIDFAGEQSLNNWYETIGKNGWRLEEFQHYYGNATFDDEATFAPALLLLRIYNEKHDPRYKVALDKTIKFLLESQYPIGGWPQRYPLRSDFPKGKSPDYSSFITLNDDVHKSNVRFLIMCYQSLGDARLLEPIRRAMNCIMILQQGYPQAGWSWQYTTDLKPTGARTYEPSGFYSGATYSGIEMLMDYFELTGETKFLARIPEALDYMKSIQLPDEIAKYFPRKISPQQKLYPSCIEISTNKPIYVHRLGSNSASGIYYGDYNPEFQWMPTFSMRAFNIDLLKERYNRLKQMSPDDASKDSPLKSKTMVSLPKYASGSYNKINTDEVEQIIKSLGSRDYWEGVFANSNPYIGDGPEQPSAGDYRTTQVGDKYDTSPFRFGENFKGVSTGEYIANMFKLICFLEEQKTLQK
jgi:PelA/Pel-15E family pectate lyase